MTEQHPNQQDYSTANNAAVMLILPLQWNWTDLIANCPSVLSCFGGPTVTFVALVSFLLSLLNWLVTVISTNSCVRGKNRSLSH